MLRLGSVVAAAVLALGLVGMFDTASAQTPDPRNWRQVDPENTLYIDTVHGRIVIELYPEIAPRHVERIKALTRAGFYDGLMFHRVIDDFMAQTGDPTATGQGGSSLPDLKAEFNDVPHMRGTVSMARLANDLSTIDDMSALLLSGCGTAPSRADPSPRVPAELLTPPQEPVMLTPASPSTRPGPTTSRTRPDAASTASTTGG